MASKRTSTSGVGRDLYGGLDRYNLGSPAVTHSNLPEHIANAEVESDEDMGTIVDCQGKDAGEDVCQIKKAEDEEAGKAAAPESRTSQTLKRK